MRPSLDNLEKILKEAKELDPNLPKDLIVIGSYSIVARIYLEKNQKINFYRDSDDVDLLIFPRDDENYAMDGFANSSFPAHFVIPARDSAVELFTYSSYSDLCGGNELVDLMLEKEGEDYKYLDKLKIGGFNVYVPKLPLIILMKVKAYKKRTDDKDRDKDKNDLAKIRTEYLDETKYNEALNYLKKLSKDKPFVKELIEFHREMFKTKSI